MIPLSARNARPVWDQVEQALGDLLDRGGFSPGERLPDPDRLAWTLALNPRAVRRAYESLARAGRLTAASDGSFRSPERGAEPDRPLDGEKEGEA